MMIRLLLICILLVNVQSQDDTCLCSCCNTLTCTPREFPPLKLSSCTTETCITHCRSTYAVCRDDNRLGGISVRCQSSNPIYYDCRCECCNTGSPSCTLNTVGYVRSTTCDSESCSVLCSQNYFQCVADQNGRTKGTCIGLHPSTTTTTVTTTRTLSSVSGNACGCYCCTNGPNCLVGFVGSIQSTACSSTSCSQTCQNQYLSQCVSSGLSNEIIGICLNQETSNYRCNCKCCNNHNCIDYQVVTSSNCNDCHGACRTASFCRNNPQISYTCVRNHAFSQTYSLYHGLGLIIYWVHVFY